MTEPVPSLPQVKFRPYRDSQEIVDDIRLLVKLWLQRHLLLYADRYRKGAGSYSDLYVAKEEIDAFLAGKIGPGSARSAEYEDVESTESSFRDYMAQRLVGSRQTGAPLPLDRVNTAFGCDDERVQDVLMALLVVELDPEFLRAYAYAWADFTQKHVDVGFLIELVSRSYADRARLYEFFLTQNHPLFVFRGLEIQPETVTPRRSLMQRPVWLSTRLIEFLSGRTHVSGTTVGVHGRLLYNRIGWDQVFVPPVVHQTVSTAVSAMVSGTQPPIRLYLHGPSGAGKKACCEAAAGALSVPLLTGDAAELSQDIAMFEHHLVAFLREARLQGALPVLTGTETLWAQKNEPDGATATEARLTTLESVLSRIPVPVIFTGHQKIPGLWEKVGGLVEVAIPHPDMAAQVKIWERTFGSGVKLAAGFTVHDVARRYSLTGGAIEKVGGQILNRRRQLNVDTPIDLPTVLPFVREHLRHRLGSIAVPVERGFGWDDLVLPKTTLSSLKEIVSFVRNRDVIVQQWGFGSKISYGRGTAALFFGPPGTGKTMAASIVGNDLAMEVFQVDLSRVVDKYIGETEKNLSRVFEEGSRAQAILLFDEADSLFGKRTSVRTAVDRYANLEVNFLLQMMESYEGISILTSNFPESIDDAFKRRIRFKVEFPFPTQKEREQLWNSMIPAAAPIHEDVSFEELAERFELSGAHIKNVVLRAASMAAQRKSVMTMDLFLRAANREYLEMGKLIQVDEDEFGYLES
ncbi:MAG: ATP-binding protein [Myxococcales bacterium]|nr:ATP-binding protein [Myxococcales bacterium]